MRRAKKSTRGSWRSRVVSEGGRAVSGAAQLGARLAALAAKMALMGFVGRLAAPAASPLLASAPSTSVPPATAATQAVTATHAEAGVGSSCVHWFAKKM